MWINIFSVTLSRKMGMAGSILFSSLQKQITHVFAQICSMYKYNCLKSLIDTWNALLSLIATLMKTDVALKPPSMLRTNFYIVGNDKRYLLVCAWNVTFYKTCGGSYLGSVLGRGDSCVFDVSWATSWRT